MTTQTAIRSDANDSKSKALLRQAVYGHKKESSLKERLFALWFSRLVYTQIWEDPEVDLQALQLGPNDHLVTIASGGCNALSYLLSKPGKVTAVDLNHAHVALVRLKIAAAQHLERHEDFFQFFGTAKSTSNLRLYKNVIAPHLDASSRQYWEGGPIGFRRIQMFAKGFYNYGLLGQLIGILHWGSKLHGVKLNELLKQPTVEAQAQWFDQNVAKIFDSKLVTKITSSPLALYNLGIPPSQHKALCDEQPEKMSQVLKQRARQLATVTPIKDNYFAWQAYGRGYDASGQSALPPYLMKENFKGLKKQLSKLSVEQNNIKDAIQNMGPESVDAVVLLDAQDWMSPAEIVDLWSTITASARPGARIIFRTAGESSPIEKALPPELNAKWRRNAQRSAELGPKDRSGIYGAFHLFELQA